MNFCIEGYPKNMTPDPNIAPPQMVLEPIPLLPPPPPLLVRQVAGYFPLEGTIDNPIDLTEDLPPPICIAG